MIGLNFGKVSKRRNSTRVPALTELPNAEMASLKDGTSVRKPVFLLNHSGGIPDWNYCRWDSRYYFVTDIIAERNDLFSIHCVLDVLATYRADILATTAFVLYDNTGNPEIIDKRLSVNTSATSSYEDGTLDIFEAGFSIILGIVGNNSTGIYALSLMEARALMNEISTWQNLSMPEPDEPDWDADPDDLSLILQNIGEAIFNFADAIGYYFRQLVATGKAPDCIKSAILVPVPKADFDGTDGATIYLGEYDTGVTGKYLDADSSAFASCDISIPWQANDWRRNEPYHHFYLSLPYVGVVSIPASEIIDVNAIRITCNVSVNGGIVYKVIKNGFCEIAQFTGNCSGSYMIGSSNVSALTSASTMISGVGAVAATALNPALGVGIGAASITGIMGSIQPLPSSVSGGGGIAFSSSGLVFLWSQFHDTNVSPGSVVSSIGLPSMQQKTLSACTGYIQCAEASVSCGAESEDIEAINSFLNGGCFIE